MSRLRIFPMTFVSLSMFAALPAWSQQDTPDPGKAAVDATCNLCHALSARVGSGYTPEGWDTVLRMMQNQGAPIPQDKLPAMRAYLVKTYPERGRPEAVIVPGPVKVTMKQWDVPTPGSRPHDPLAARDGSLWYTGQLANHLGRIDPKTGAIKEYALKTPHSGPHGLVEDRHGNIWYTGNAGGLIGRLDPKTGEVTEYPTGPEAKDPHTPLFDRKGILWFTAQNANRIGRLDPKTGQIRYLTPPTEHSRPYGMSLDSKGNIYYAAFGSNRIGYIDTRKLTIREFPLPDAKSRPRRIAVGPGDLVWFTDFSTGRLGRLDPKTGRVKEWRSPSGPKSEPYGISVIKGKVWYSESGATPTTVVRFDPKTQKFQSWAIPGGGNIVRNTSVARNGDFVLANSLVNKVTLVRMAK